MEQIFKGNDLKSLEFLLESLESIESDLKQVILAVDLMRLEKENIKFLDE